MFWLTKIADEILADHPEGEIVISSGVSPSGTYHVGTLREVMTAEAIYREIKRRGRQAKHIHVVDDLDVFRKIPVNVPEDEYKQYLGRPLCDIPAPDGSGSSYADFFLKDLLEAGKHLGLEMEVMRAHKKYRSGFFTEAIEKSLENVGIVRSALETISGHKLGGDWAPVQINEDGYLKNRKFIALDKETKQIKYADAQGNERIKDYTGGGVKLNWRIDWPARWWLLGVRVEPFGRDHATKGGSYDTGAEIVRKVFSAEPPMPVPYNFVNKTGDTKKMSKSAGDVITAADLVKILPPEVVWYFMLRYAPEKQLFFDEGPTMVRLIDEFSALLDKADKTEAEKQLLEIAMQGIDWPTVSKVPFSHLVASYQAALKDADKTLEIIGRTEHGDIGRVQAETIRRELVFIDEWLNSWAPEDVKFSLKKSAEESRFTLEEKAFLKELADKIQAAPSDADGEWFHNAIYEFKERDQLSPQQLFAPLYRVLIGKEQGPRAGWFLSILPREQLLRRLRFED